MSTGHKTYHEKPEYEEEFKLKYGFGRSYAMCRRAKYTPPGTSSEYFEKFNTSLEAVLRTNPDAPIEGGSTVAHIPLFKKLLKPYKKKSILIAEIGFNAGTSAECFLKCAPKAKMVSFDLIHHKYIMTAKKYINHKYPGRHTLIGGNSLETVPAFAEMFGEQKMDVIFIDGNHLYDFAVGDIVNMKKLSTKKTLVILDNVAPHRGCSVEVYLAWYHLLNIGYIKHIGFEELNTYDITLKENPKVKPFIDGGAWFSYNMKYDGDIKRDIKTFEAGKLPIPKKLPDFDHINRIIPGWELSKKYQALTRNPKADQRAVKVIKAKLDYLYNKTIQTGVYYVDDFYKSR